MCFLKICLTVILFFPVIQLSYAQDHHDWASTLNFFKNDGNSVSRQVCDGVEMKHRVVDSDSYGKEFYCSGNLHAEGTIKFKSSVTVIQPDGRSELQTEYVRDGNWKVYYDSSVQIIRSKGQYKNGEREGKWVIYYPNGKLKFIFEYASSTVKTKIYFDENGNKETLVQKSNWNIHVDKYKGILIFLAVFPIVVIRIGWNISTYNEINGTAYVPFLQNWQTGGWEANLYCTFTFWWFHLSKDTPKITRYKTTSNRISIISVLWFFLVLQMFVLFGERNN